MTLCCLRQGNMIGEGNIMQGKTKRGNKYCKIREGKIHREVRLSKVQVIRKQKWRLDKKRLGRYPK